MNKSVKPRVLATDLDGTLIPLNNHPEHHVSLRQLRQKFSENNFEFVFVTGRHLASVLRAIDQFHLPTPDWILCDVGSSIYRRDDSGSYQIHDAYADHLQCLLGVESMTKIRDQLRESAGMRFQEEEKQSRFKLSFYCMKHQISRQVVLLNEVLLKHSIQCQIISSADPFNHDGLIDLLPANVSKAYALNWWAASQQIAPDSIVFAGDSGNDLAAMTAGFKTIVVGNASDEVKRAAIEAHQVAGHPNRIWIAEAQATSAVLAGCYHFGMIDEEQK